MITFAKKTMDLDENTTMLLNILEKSMDYPILTCKDYNYNKNKIIQYTGIDFQQFKNASNPKKHQIARDDFHFEDVNF